MALPLVRDEKLSPAIEVTFSMPIRIQQTSFLSKSNTGK
jgi:hypothetical protein